MRNLLGKSDSQFPFLSVHPPCRAGHNFMAIVAENLMFIRHSMNSISESSLDIRFSYNILIWSPIYVRMQTNIRFLNHRIVFLVYPFKHNYRNGQQSSSKRLPFSVPGCF